MTDEIFIATESFTAIGPDGTKATVRKGLDRVRGGHWLLESKPDAFKPVDQAVTFDVEQATAAPGEKRGEPPAKSKAGKAA